MEFRFAVDVMVGGICAGPRLGRGGGALPNRIGSVRVERAGPVVDIDRRAPVSSEVDPNDVPFLAGLWASNEVLFRVGVRAQAWSDQAVVVSSTRRVRVSMRWVPVGAAGVGPAAANMHVAAPSSAGSAVTPRAISRVLVVRFRSSPSDPMRDAELHGYVYSPSFSRE